MWRPGSWKTLFQIMPWHQWSMAPSHCPKQCWFIANKTQRAKLQWNFDHNKQKNNSRKCKIRPFHTGLNVLNLGPSISSQIQLIPSMSTMATESVYAFFSIEIFESSQNAVSPLLFKIYLFQHCFMHDLAPDGIKPLFKPKSVYT